MQWRLHSVAVPDPHGFGRPLDASRLLVPLDWRPEGGVRWVANPVPSMMVQVQFRALAPDGRTGVEVLPHYVWTWNDDPLSADLAARSAAMGQGAPVMPPMGFGEFVHRMILPAQRPGCPILEVLPDPETSRKRAAKASVGWAGMATVASDVATVRIGLQGGIEERIVGAIDDLRTSAMSNSAVMMGMYGVQTVAHQLTAQDIWVFRYPMGTWDQHEKLFTTIAESVRPNPAWVQAAGAVMQGTARSLMEATLRDAEIWRRTQAEIGELHRSTWEARQASDDRRHEAFGQALRGVETWSEPGGTRVELSAGYREAWTNGLGEYIVSDEPLFDPNLHDQRSWTRLTRPS